MFKVRRCCSAMVDQDIEGRASGERPKLTYYRIYVIMA